MAPVSTRLLFLLVATGLLSTGAAWPPAKGASSMANVSDLTRVTQHLEKVQVGERVSSIVDSESDNFLKMCEAKSFKSDGGSGFVTKIIRRDDMSINPQYDLAQAGGSPGRERIELMPVPIYWSAKIELRAIDAALEKGARWAFDLIKEETDLRKTIVRDTLARDLDGTGWGGLAGIGAINSTVVTLAQPDESSTTAVPEFTNRFTEGLTYGSADHEATGNARGSTPGTYNTLNSIDHSAGTLTFAAVTDFVVGDILFAKGFRAFDAAAKRVITGQRGWLSNAAIGGLTRSSKPGTFPLSYSAANDASMVDALISADAFYFRMRLPRKGMVVMVPGTDLKKITQALEARGLLSKGQGEVKREGYTIGYSYYSFQGLCGEWKIMPSTFWLPGTMSFGPFDDSERGFKLAYGGDALHNLIKDGNGNAVRVLPAGMTDNSGNIVPAYIVEGYSTIQTLCGSPGSYLNVTSLPSE